MKYFKVNCAGVLGKKVVKLEIECVQQRRLPYLQIIGLSSGDAMSMRERVLAAIESAGVRLPARRFTLSVLNSGGIPPSEIDLAVSLAVIGSAGAIPPASLSNFLASGALSLDGRLQNLHCRAPLRAFRLENPSAGLLLPWEDSHILGAEGEGGGFHSLAEVIEFLREPRRLGPRRVADDVRTEARAEAWQWLRGRPLAQKVLPVIAAGGHPLLVVEGAGVAAMAEDLYSLLPPLEPEAEEEVMALQKIAGESGERRPMRELSADQASRLLRFDPKLGIYGEISMAHGGLLLVRRLGDRPSALFRQLREPIETASIRFYRAGQSVLIPADWQLVAATPFCFCSGKEACRCTPQEIYRWRGKLEEVRPFFPIFYHEESEMGSDAPPPARLREQVRLARELALARQKTVNNRLRLEECFRVKTWEPEAIDAWRIAGASSRNEGNLAKVALTLSDLRRADRVSRADVMEARYYVPESFVPWTRSGSRLWSGSVPSTKSSAIP